jgi:glyoxylase-like metal-dependent hydrolase (beta-lactamase superfamily II)
MSSNVKPVHSFDHGIHAIDTYYVRPGLDASHLIVEGDRAAFVDTGPSSAVPHLLAAMKQLGVAPEQVDFVLLTHVHLDHAGGAGLLMKSLPRAQAVIHPRGARHMIDPTKLVAGSIEVYGEHAFRKLYGEIVPIDAGRVVVADDGMRVNLAGRQLELIHAPGHALHHYCVVDRAAQAIFSGDNFGVSYRELDTARGAFIFPTTTPVQFDPDAMHATIDRLVSYRPRAIFLTHYSRVTEIERLARDLHECVDGFVAIATRHQQTPDRSARIRAGLFEFLSQRLVAHGWPGSEAERHAVIDKDVELNAQGLEVWLDRRASAA